MTSDLKKVADVLKIIHDNGLVTQEFTTLFRLVNVATLQAREVVIRRVFVKRTFWYKKFWFLRMPGVLFISFAENRVLFLFRKAPAPSFREKIDRAAEEIRKTGLFVEIEIDKLKFLF